MIFSFTIFKVTLSLCILLRGENAFMFRYYDRKKMLDANVIITFTS